MLLPSRITEEELLRRCKTGDLKSIEMLYKQFYGFAMGIGLRYCASRDIALEAVNDGFIRVFRSLDQYQAEKPFKAWLRRIVVNAAIDKNRSEHKHSWTQDIGQAEKLEDQVSPLDALNVRDILNMLDRLPEAYRMVFNLYEIDGYSHDEIAAIMSVTASTSRVYLSRSKERLREMITQTEKDNERRV